MSQERPKCLYPECDRERRTRGLCTMHYHRAMQLVQQHRTTWDKLVAAGKCLAVRSQYKPGFTDWALESDD